MSWKNKPDYTGASAQEYVDRYTNRPEDAGSLEGLQNLLGNIGMIPGIGEPADLLNAAIYGAQGKGKEAGLSALSMLPILGGLIKPGKNVVKAIKLKNTQSLENIKTIKKLEKSIKQKKVIESYASVLKTHRKYGKYPKMEDFPITAGGPGHVARSLDWENYKKNLEYYLDNYKDFIKTSDISKSEIKSYAKIKKGDKTKLDDMLLKLLSLIKKGD